MDDCSTPEKILFRLEELRKWQKIQEERLLQHQMLQRKQLEDEQNKLFENLGSSHEDYSCESYDDESSSSKTHSFYTESRSEENTTPQVKFAELSDIIEGVTPLNISSESEPCLTLIPSTTQSVQTDDALHISETPDSKCDQNSLKSQTSFKPVGMKNQRDMKQPTVGEHNKNKMTIKLDDIPIIPLAKDFNSLLEVKIKNNDAGILAKKGAKAPEAKSAKKPRPFLKRGQGLTRFNMKPGDVRLPKTKKLLPGNTATKIVPQNKVKTKSKSVAFVNPLQSPKTATLEVSKNIIENSQRSNAKFKKKLDYNEAVSTEVSPEVVLDDKSDSDANLTEDIIELIKSKKTWASLLTEEQEYYIRLLENTRKYQPYFNASDMSDISSTSPAMVNAKARREVAEQNMFDLLEKKVDNSSFCSTSSFIAKVVGNHGTDTPTANLEYVQTNPHVLNLKPTLSDIKTIENLNSSRESLDTVAEECHVGIARCQGKVKDNESDSDRFDKESKSEDSDNTEYSESTDTEQTCKTVRSEDFPTSTPNRTQPEITNDNLKCKEFYKKTSPRSKDKVIKIVICPKSSHNTNDDSDSQMNVEDKTLAHEDTSTIQLRNDLEEKAVLLKMRLEELQREIEVFKNENRSIAKMKSDMEEEREAFSKEKAEIERKLNEDKIVAEYYLSEEREKLAKQKSLYDRHIKDMKGISQKKDREEIANLKKEITDLKEQIKARDSKAGVSQARLRNQIKCLEKENSDIKAEYEKLKKANIWLKNSNTRSRRLTNIKSLAEINRSLSQFSLGSRSGDIEIEDVYPDKNISKEYYDEETSRSKSKKQPVKPTVIKHSKPVRAKSVPNLSRTSHYAKYFSKRDEEDRQKQRRQLGYNLNSDSELSSDSEGEHSKSFDNNYGSRNLPKTVDASDRNSLHRTSLSRDNSYLSYEGRSSTQRSGEMNYTCEVEKEYSERFSKGEINTSFEGTEFLAGIQKPSSFVEQSAKAPPSKASDSSDHVIIDRPDGCKEIRFTNGNVKIVSPDASYSKFLYYNGDIKETFYNEGTIKYYYKEVNTHHTTYKDGSQVLEFPDGQIERRYPDGSVESQLADGATRWARAGGTQEWRFPDGTLLVVTPQGDRTLRFPNGQVEVHTKDHKRREYPDGTVKVVYADGVVETRYANGRIRVKDKNDKLLLDSAGNHLPSHHVTQR